MNVVCLLTMLLNSGAKATDAPCAAEVAIQEAINISYDPFDSALENTSFTITFDNTGRPECSIEVDFQSESGGAPPFAMRGGDISLHIEPIVTGSQLRALEPGRYLVVLASDAVEERTFNILPMSDSLPRAGQTSTYFRASITDVNNKTNLLADELILTVLDVIASAQINLAGADAAFQSAGGLSRVDFGELETGETRRVFVQFRSTSEAQMTIRSANAGQLVREPDVGRSLSYSLMVDGSAVDLSASAAISINPTGSLSGESLPVDIKIGDVSGAFAGRYTDIISFEISPF